MADDNSAFCQQIFNTSTGQIKAEVLPGGIANNFRWESVDFVSIHNKIIDASLLIGQHQITD